MPKFISKTEQALLDILDYFGARKKKGVTVDSAECTEDVVTRIKKLLE